MTNEEADPMTRAYLVAGIAALAFFSYAQHQGMSVFGSRGAQQLASGGGGSGGSGWRSSSISHK
jgi:hypothetical protein